jgi:CubicO group peptidase (beta-lactamase class C family)
MKQILRLATLLLGAVSACHANAATVQESVDNYLQAEMQRQKIPGLSLAIVKNGKPFYVKSYGVATLEHAVPTLPRTVYQIGSIGKQFTAVAVMMLVNEHRLNLDDPLSKYLPEIPPSWSHISLRLMLNHQSGIPQFTTPQRQLLDLAHDYTDDELIHLAASQPLDFEPGTDVSYSDTGYVLLGFVVNRVAGQFYGDLLQQRVFAPLGMSRTRVISDTDIIVDRASGYEKTVDGTLRNQTAVSPALNRTADGSLYSTVLDLMKWDRALDGDAVLPHAQLERMWQIDAHRDGQRPLYHYGYGWENNTLGGHQIIEYDGNWQGFQAVMSRYTAPKITVIILTNLALCRTERLAHTVAGIVDPALKPYSEATHDSQPKLTAAFNSFLNAVAAGSADFSVLSEAARTKLVPSTMNTLQRDLRELGSMNRFSLAQDVSPEHPQRRVYRVEGDDMVEFYTVDYTDDSRIDSLDLFREY